LAIQSTEAEKKEDVLAKLRGLLAAGQTDEVLAIFAKLLADNRDLNLQLGRLIGRRHKNEGVSTSQLAFFIEQLAAGGDLSKAFDEDEDLREASRIEEKRIEREAAEAAKAVAPRPRQPRLRKPLPTNLRRIANEIKVPEEKRSCPSCRGERVCIGHDVTEVIHLIPAEVVVRQDMREKLACPACQGEVARAQLGDKVVPGGRFSSSLVAEILIDKYDTGLPLHRQKIRYQRLGIDIPISTLADQVGWSADLLRPVWHAAFEAVLVSLVMHLDATGIPVRDRDAPDGIRLGSLWGYVGGETALYLYASTGKKTGQKPGEIGPEDFLAERTGYTVADASSLFDKSFRRPGIIEIACNMHARRYFAKALDGGDHRAALPLAAFKELYDIEAEARDLGATQWLEARQTRSRHVYLSLLRWARKHQPEEPPGSPMGAAIQYLLNHQVALTRFLEDVAIPLDNGAVERLHVRAALTRKNYLFAGSDTGAERAAIAYTVLGSCRLAGVNPHEYLRDVLPRLAVKRRIKDAPELLPAAWKAAREARASVAA
jgi:transposase